MNQSTLKQQRKSRIGPKDFKRNLKAKRASERAIGFVFASMVACMALMISSSSL
tara:strand:+ start:639 stop:800 length:162 start_codon:yes stop_codon:yes gene_type:complete